MTTTRQILRGSTEYLEVTVTSTITLDAQPVAFSFDRETWLPAEWTGTAGTTRTARALVSDANLPQPRSVTPVYVRVTDNPEAPVINAGTLSII